MIFFFLLQCQNKRRAEEANLKKIKNKVIIAICLFNAGSLGESVSLSVLQQFFIYFFLGGN